MKIQFYLQKPKAPESAILFSIQNGYKEVLPSGKEKYIKIQRSTGLKIKTKFWNKEKNEIRVCDFKKEYDYKINSIRKFLNNLDLQYKDNNEQLTIDKLKYELDVYFGKIKQPEPEQKEITFFDFSKQLLIDKQQKEFVSTLRRTNEILQEFESETKYKINFDTINLTFYDRFMNFMNNRSYSINYKGKQISNIKYFMNEAYERSLHDNREFKSRKFKSMEELVEKIYLTDAEIRKIYDLDLSNKPYLDNARDLFLIGCYSGLRFSDFSQVRPDNINKDFTILTIRTQKTDKKVYVPLRQEVTEIIKKHNGTPRSISNAKLNVYIKEVGKLAEINGDVVVYKSQGTQTTKEVKQKYQLICTHTARRSFATNCYKAGIPIKSIMLITGHSTEIDFFKYIRITEAENAELLLNHEYFNR